MNVIRKIISIFQWKWKNSCQKLEQQPQPLEDNGMKPLSTYSISYFFHPLADLLNDNVVQLISLELNVPQTVTRKELQRLTDRMRSDVTCCIEYPYVDEYYRDTYYTFYSRKHSYINRYCFRISFFSSEVTESNFFDIDMDGRFWGYAVLRPTPQRLIGYTFLSPQLYQDTNFSCCLCSRKPSILGRKLVVYAFPFCGQDREVVSCAETTLILLLDYLSRRYNKYSRLLPSEILPILKATSMERELPSQGLGIDSVAHILQTYGCKVRIYSRKRKEYPDGYSSEEFAHLINIYIDSGFPIYACTATHAMLIIGKENRLGHKGVRFVVMNDNERPYTLLDSIEEISSFMVPLSDRIYLDADGIDAEKALKWISKCLPNFKPFRKGETYYSRLFLTTSRSYKSHFVTQTVDADTRMLVACVPMPRFIWVCEMLNAHEQKKGINDMTLSTLSIYDATENDVNYNHLIMAIDEEHLLVPESDLEYPSHKHYRIYEIQRPEIHLFRNNLKGEHTQWQN